ncbi:MAG: CDP-alcohol phosphatidyltransferase family protein [Candidatus Merdivicinus sp.]
MNIPNSLTVIRILLVPLFIWTFFHLSPEYAYVPVLLLLLSGLTDIADGFIARKFHMITPLGRFLDPVADKLTICTAIICLSLRHQIVWILVGIYVVKEVTLALIGLARLKSWRNSIAAKWYGKASTVLLYILMLSIMLFPTISDRVILILMIPPVIFIILSFIFYLKEINIHKKEL